MGAYIPTLRGLVIELAVMLAAGIALAAVGPYGSFYLGSFADRLLYWLPAAFVGYLIVRPFVVAALVTSERLALPLAPTLAAAVFVAAVPMTFFILWLNGDAFGLPDRDGWLQLYLQIALIGAVITLLFWLLERPKLPAPASAKPADVSAATAIPAEPTPGAAFLDRLPPHLGRELLALEMEDHYVRAHTANGSALILLRMRDAVAELAGVDGMQVHRSWWVARAAVEKPLVEGRNVRLRLKGGLEAPVARNNVPALRSAGWLG